jgi:error-prone DNA polymerase
VFTHLHCHSTWSLLDGAIPAEVLPHLAASRGFEAVALTDHDALTGAVRFSRACREAGVKPIFGAELTLEQGEHVTLIARDATGYGNLCGLISRAHLSNERGSPCSSFEEVAASSEGLFVLSGCSRGHIARLAARGLLPHAVEAARRWRRAIGDNYRIEVFDLRGYGHRTLRDRLLRVAHEASISAVATNDVHYADPFGAATHEVLHAIKDIVPLSRAHCLRTTSELYLKTSAEMAELFSDVPEVLSESAAITEACDFDLEFGVYHFPEVPLARSQTPTQLLAHRCYQGVQRRFGKLTNKVEERLQHELQMIFKLGFAAYFMMVSDIVSHVRSELGIYCACRGSAAGSLVCYLLGISDVDPVRYDLLFERFINERRDELPDIDIDVESHRREEVLDHILKTYGAEQTAVCCMVDTFRARMAIRDVGKALGLPVEEIDVVAKAFPRIAARNIPQAIERLPELAGSNLERGQLAQLFELCLEIDGFPRHLALHPSGVILSSADLCKRVPMQESFEGFCMLQADKDDVIDLGLVKLDVLGVRMLSAISHARAEIERVTNERVDLDAISHDDAATFALVKSSNTLGCFQIESPGQRELLARLQPNRFEDLIVEISLFRPGPVKSDMVTPFLERRHGFEAVPHIYEALREIVAETHGVIVYHEQLIRGIAAATGCSLADADYVRRHLEGDGPGLPEGLEDGSGATSMEDWFKHRARTRGLDEAHAAALWKEVFAFASFGFCKSHAAAFALPTFLSAWLKAHYPTEFLAGVLTHDPGMYPRRAIVADARSNGIPILGLDVNRSDGVYRVEQAGGRRGIRLSLSEVCGISSEEIDAIVANRPFTSVEDLWRRTGISRPVLEALTHVGALDSIEPRRTRRELVWRSGELSCEPRPEVGDQLSLALEEADPGSSLSGLRPYAALEEVEAELEVTGIDARRHIMELYAELTGELGCTPSSELHALRNNSETWVAGVKVSTQTPAIRSGQRIIFATLDDVTGPLDVTVFERAQARCARTVFHSWLLAVRGVVRKRGGASFIHEMVPNVGITVVAHEVFDLAELASERSRGHSVATALGRQRRRQSALAPAASSPMPKLWHASGGSAGR